MRSGIQWDEWSTSYGSNENPFRQLKGSQDWARFVLERTVVHEPGTWFTYNSGNSILIGEVLHRVTGKRTADLGNERLFRKLGIRGYFWFVGPDGATDTGGGLSLRSRDMAKLGLLFLHRGQWEGEQLIPGDWVDDSIQLYSNLPGREGYGYQWWIMDLGDPPNRVLIPLRTDSAASTSSSHSDTTWLWWSRESSTHQG